MKYKDYYQTLGVARTASPADIKKAYRKLAHKYHPDVSKETGAEEKFKEVGEAYEVLKDPEKRAAYDELGRHRAGEDFRPPPEWGQHFRGGAPGGSTGYTEVDLSDLLAELFGGSARAGGQPRGAHVTMGGQDYEATVELPLEDAYRGTEITLDLALPQYPERGAPMRKPVKVRIPKGVTDGQKMRVPGKGGPGINGGSTGDLYLNIVLRPHPLFRVSGHDLYIDVPVAPWEAALGADMEIPTLAGPVRLKIKPGTTTGQKLRLAGKGLPQPGGGQGDLYAFVQIVTPPNLSAKERALFEQLARASSFNPRAHFKR